MAMINVSGLQANISNTFQIRRTELVAIVSVFTVFSVVGLLLSITLFLTILLRPRLHTGSGILIAHNQFLHVLQTGITNPFYIVTCWAVWLGGMDITGVNRLLMNFFCKMFTFAELWAAFFLAVNRFVALVYPHRYGIVSSRCSLVLLMVIPWMIGIALTVPGLYGIGGLFGMRQVDCGFVRISNQLIATTVIILGIYVPCACQGGLYAAIMYSHMKNAKKTQISSIQAKRFVFFRLLLGAYLWFILGYLPQPIVVYGFPQFYFEDKVRAGWFTVLQQVGYAGSPVFLLLLNKEILRNAKPWPQRANRAKSSASVLPFKVPE